jgi:hypothetical protein
LTNNPHPTGRYPGLLHLSGLSWLYPFLSDDEAVRHAEVFLGKGSEVDLADPAGGVIEESPSAPG